MLKKIVSIVSVVALSVAFVGCDAGAMADKAKGGADSAAGAGHDAAANAAPAAADAGGDKATEATDEAAAKPAE
jgi:hypothetical protein